MAYNWATRTGIRGLLALPLSAALLVAQPGQEIVVSVGHAGAPDQAAFAGGFLATVSWSTVALIDLSSGLTTSHLPQSSLVEALEANPAGDLLAVGTCGHAIQLWNLKSRRLQRRIALTQECAESLSFSPDGLLLATGAYSCCQNGGLQVWDVRSGTLTRELGKGLGFRKVLFSRNGQWIAGVDDAGKASIFEWPSGRPLPALMGLDHAGETQSVAASSADGKYLAWLGGRDLDVWDVKTGAQVSLPAARGMVSTAEFLNDGRLAYVDDDRAVFVTLPGGQIQEQQLERRRPRTPGDAIFDSPSWLRIRRDGLMLAGAHESRTEIWDVATRNVRDMTSPALPDGSTLLWSRSGIVAWADYQSGVRSWNDRTGELSDPGTDIDSAEGLAFRSDGDRLLVTDYSSLHVLDLRRRRSVNSMELPPLAGAAVAFSPDGARIAFNASGGLVISDDMLRKQTRLAKLDADMRAKHIVFSPDGRWIAAGLEGPQPAVRVWPATGPGDVVTLDTNRLTYGPQPPAFSSDSRWLATFTKGSFVSVWTASSWVVERTWNLPGTGQALAFAPEGPRLAIAGDGEAAIWDASTGRKAVTLTSPGSSQHRAIAWSPDGKRLVTSTDDGVFRFWNASDGRLVASLYTPVSSLDWLLVTPDGRFDGTERALSTLVAWHAGDKVALNRTLTDRNRVRGLWKSVTAK